MKTLKMLVLVVTITFSSFLSARTNPIEKAEPTSITQSVWELLKKPNFTLKNDVSAMVDVFINENDEMIVLFVATDNKSVESYIKTRLNYKKLSKELIGNRKSFKVPVKILKSK